MPENLIQFVSLAFFLILAAAALLTPAYWRARDRKGLLQLADAAIQRGAPLTADAIRALPGGQEWLPQSQRDLRRGILLIAAALGFFLLGVFVHGVVSTFDPRSSAAAGLIVAAFGAFPAARGVALVVLSRFDRDDTV